MKQLPWLAVGIIVGFLVGGIGPRREVDGLRAQVGELEDAALRSERRASLRSSLVPGLGAMLQPAAEAARAERREEEAAPEEDPEEEEVSAEEEDQEDRIQPSSDEGPSLQDFDAAIAAQRVRVEQSREALREQADLDDEQMDEIDGITAAMNDLLADHASEVVDLLLTGEEPSPRELLGITHDITGILFESQTALEEVVGEEVLGDVDEEALVVWNYVDLESFRGAIEELAAQEGTGPLR